MSFEIKLDELDRHTLSSIYLWGDQMCVDHRKRKIPDGIMGGGFLTMRGRRKKSCPWCWRELGEAAVKPACKPAAERGTA
jgi:hypothetical protein